MIPTVGSRAPDRGAWVTQEIDQDLRGVEPALLSGAHDAGEHLLCLGTPCRAVGRRCAAKRCLLGVTVLVWFGGVQPINDRNWPSDLNRLAWAEIDEARVTIHNIRDLRYRSTTDWDERWYTATYDTRELQGVDFFTVDRARAVTSRR